MAKIKNLLILGAGTDKSSGLDIPLAQELINGIRDFLSNEPVGLEVDKLLRSFLKDLNFSYNNLSKEASAQLIETYEIKREKLLNIVKQGSVNQEEKELLDLIQYFLKQKSLKFEISYDNKLLIEKIINNYKNHFSGKEKTETIFKKIMEKSFLTAIHNPNYVILNKIYNNCIDFEMLLLKYFIGFYNKTHINIKRYLYISWTLWAFLCWKERQALEHTTLPFYGSIDKNRYNVITLNYTSFASNISDCCIYFHGKLDKHINLYNRMVNPIPTKIDIAKFINTTVKTTIDFSRGKFIIPFIIPPLKMKPIISKEFIDIWYNATQIIKDSERIVIVGYSFNPVDEHFNDIIRKNKKKEIIIVDPYPKNNLLNLKRIFSYKKDNYQEGVFKGKNYYKYNSLMIIEAGATDLSIDELFEMTTISTAK
ncbi:MAG: hypothetical protein J6W62_02880 [Spirochaetia bacterium]|nr:hypothetical protein [Spirochaetia bacterium]